MRLKQVGVCPVPAPMTVSADTSRPCPACGASPGQPCVLPHCGQPHPLLTKYGHRIRHITPEVPR